MPSTTNHDLLVRASKVLPGGVNSPVRAFGSVGGHPVFVRSGDGPFLRGEDGREYLDFVCSWGPLILGHNASCIRDAVSHALQSGTSFGAPTLAEVEFAELLCERLSGVEMIRLVNSGTEAMMSLARLARAATGRDTIIKCDGCYHGHADSFLVKAGSGAATQGISGSAGVPDAIVGLSASVPYNDLDAMQEAIEHIGAQRVAAIVVEPVPGNMGLVLPGEGYLQGLRALCDTHGILLVFDEVMSGFRVALGGAIARFGVFPDLVAYGKVIGGGLPLAAFGGRSALMEQLAPCGPVYQAGTLSGNPLAVAAGMAAVTWLFENDPFAELEAQAVALTEGFAAAAISNDIALQTSVCGSMFGFFFSPSAVRNFVEAQAANQAMFKAFFHEMLKEGVYLAPSPFEAGFLSTAHRTEHIQEAIAAAGRCFSRIAAV